MSIRPCVCAKHTQGHFASYPNIKFYFIYIHIYYILAIQVIITDKKSPLSCLLLYYCRLYQIASTELYW